MMRKWVETWKQAGPELEKIRLREVRDEDNRLSLQILESAFNLAAKTEQPDSSSGLVEMQRYFAKLRK